MHTGTAHTAIPSGVREQTRSATETAPVRTGGHLEVQELTTARLRKWRDDLASSPARLRSGLGKELAFRPASDDRDAIRQRRSTANRVLTILKAALNHAWNEGEVPSDDAWRRLRPFKDADSARVRYLTEDECTRLVNSTDPGFRPMVQAALLTGCRYSELASLVVADYSSDAGAIQVRITKSGKPRHVILTADGQSYFDSLTAGREPEELMFRKANGNPWGRSHQTRPLRSACEHAGIKPPANFHALRHTYASHAVMGGVPLQVVADNLGHADTRMVEKYYGHLAPSYKAEQIRAGTPTLGVIGDTSVTSIRANR
jgi:integrase